MIHFYFCDPFKEKLKGLAVSSQEKINKKFLEYKKRDDLKNIGNVESLCGGELYILKIKQPESRIIIQLNEINNFNDESKVFFVRDIITNVKFDREYGRLLYGKIKRGDWLSENPLMDEDIDNFKLAYSQNKIIVKSSLSYPPEELINWFNYFDLTLKNEIFETKEWVAYALENKLNNGMLDKYVNTFRIAINHIISSNEDFPIIKNDNNMNIYQYVSNNIGIIFSKIILNENEYLLLHYGAHIEVQKEYWEECLHNIEINKREYIPDEETLYRLSFRSYPKWTLKEDELWFRIAKSEENSNLSLTTEQVDFLKNFKFPCYINGQAGSGKSTLLYYIFANIIFLKHLDYISGEIIFLTENEQLLDDTVQNVFDLLGNNPEFQLPMEEIIKNKNCFDSFKNFLLNMLNENDLENFEDDKYLHFPIFKNFYETSTIKGSIINEYSAEEVWFVIVTYIYGHDVNIKITSENYEDKINNKARKITLERFKDIETHVLPFYDSLLDKGYWDKLKIIRYIDKNINIDLKTKYSVIVCDESQDFCKVELSFILKQSNYLQYDLSKIEQMPIIFAGDSNQTVNPTGFSDAEMTSLLYQELQEIKFNYNSENTFYSPNLNYRSSAQVVNLANFIQFHRMKHLGMTKKLPQESKRPEQNIDEHFNIFLNYETINSIHDLKDDLHKKLKYKIFIVPTNSEEKLIYKKDSELLSQFEDIEIKTSVESKGAEYKQVVLYGFGEYFLKYFKDLENSNQDDEFQKMYYFNKLYVAITRAKAELIIIDSAESKELFWEVLVNNVDIANQNGWSKLKSIQSKTIVYNSDSIKNILESTKEDAFENAKEDKKLGEFYQNPSRLKVAASQFLRLGNMEDANICLGLAEEIDHNYKSSAEYFLKANKFELASIAYFKGRYFNDLEKIGISLQSIDHEIRIIITRIMNNELILDSEIQKLTNNISDVLNITKDLQWRDELIKVLISFLDKINDLKYRNDFINLLETIAKTQDLLLNKRIGLFYFTVGNYKKAIKTWERIDFYDHENYYFAKLKFYEEKDDSINSIIFLYELIKYKDENQKKGYYQKIVDIHSKNDTLDIESTESEYFLIIYETYIMLEDLNNAISFSTIVEEKVYVSELEACYQKIIQNNVITKKIFNYLIEQWAKIVVDNIESFEDNYLDIVNKEYQIQSEKYQLPFKPFTIEEIQNLSNPLDEFKLEPSGHFSNLTIRNFRQFDSLSLTDIGQFNLIVGDNNVGKTSLLEGLLFMNDIDLYYNNLAFAYIARNNTSLIKQSITDIKYELPNNFIFDFFKYGKVDNNLEFELQEDRQQWTYRIRIPTKDEVKLTFPLHTAIDEIEFICMECDNKESYIRELESITKKVNPDDIIKMQFIPFGKGFDKTLAKSYYDNIDKDKKNRMSFLNSMKIFIPKIERITADTSSGKINVEESNHDETFPLHQYGEGANKLFRILVQITLQKDKKLLIDEIDAGIHYSHFGEFWRIILEVAKDNNVQIFATTHNIECVEYFKNILEEMTEYQKLSKIITLRRIPNNQIKAYTYKFEEFEYELNNEFEIRGGAL